MVESSKIKGRGVRTGPIVNDDTPKVLSTRPRCPKCGSQELMQNRLTAGPLLDGNTSPDY
jgi:hypothetical protein